MMMNVWADKTVLFAEDDEASYVYLSELLKIRQTRVIHCVSGLSAFFQCMNNPDLDLVIMDMKLPELSGFDCTRFIKKYRPLLPVIAVTACAMLEDRRRCKLSGCDGYLSKPVNPGDFYALINPFLGQKQPKQAEYSLL